MFMRGPFMRYPFMSAGIVIGSARMVGTSSTSASFSNSTAWDAELDEDNAPMVYLAVIRPIVLTDRS